MPSPVESTPPLTDEQRLAVTSRYLTELAEQEPNLLPRGIFLPVAKLMVMITVEVGLVKPAPTDERRAQVVLIQRPATDEFWANQWHIPGSIVRATDPVKHEHDYDAAVSRVVNEVGGGIQLVSDPLEYDIVRRKGLRGSEATVRLMAEADGQPVRGAFFDTQAVLKNPPEGGLIDSHAEAIEKLAAKYHDLQSR